MADVSANRRLKIEAHDASRVEWSIYIPLPHGKETTEAEVDLRLEFPENVYAPHDGWDHLQMLARLSSPDEEAAPKGPTTFDGVRRAALGVARRMKLLRESIPRAALAHALNPMPVAPSLARDLDRTLDQAAQLIANARATLVAPRPTDTPELSRERALADEFLSGQLLESLTVAEETCSRMLQPSGLLGYRAVAQKLRARVADALAAELAEREKKGELLPEADDTEGLALFLDRAAQLKKHFQEVLFLEPETQMVDAAVRNWVGAGAAGLAFVIYFGLQTLQTSAAAGVGLATIMTVGALAYALKDRAKELSRQWLAGKLSHLYANRVTILREPARFERGRNVVLRARESLAQDRLSRPDPLNPGTGAQQRVVTVHYRQRARVMPLKGRTGGVFERLKLVFRYDLAPILSRLDDSVKRVPVPAGGREKVRFADAPRLYRVAMSLSVRTPAGIEKRETTIVLQRQGIARIVGEQPALPALSDLELPDLDDAGLADLLPQS
ncbi:MAG TPA: hypothetical protein VF993_13460 [Myxococcales bacterium]